ncbi:MAG: glycoside hydrolase family 25 protein, partial [Chitinophagaceae bacterium]|nr:glycoside hydrolase family 25 protein [Chitinophagaceae bacterium]
MESVKGRGRNIRRRLRKHRAWVVSAMVLIFAAASLYVGDAIVEVTRVPEAPTYESFGIKLPSGYKLYGIDVSKYQGNIDWQAVRGMRVDSIQLSFAFMKATEGFSLKDDMFERNWRKSREAGLSRGAYHFFMPDRSGKVQANFF